MAKNYDRIRKPDIDYEYTPSEIVEMRKCKKDIVYFCRKYVKIQHPVRGSIPFKLYPYQIKMLRAYQQKRFVVVLSARQTGKSITSAIFLLWYAIFHKDQNILIASNKNAGAMEMISRIKHAYEELPMFLKPGIMDDGWNKHTVIFDNKSKIDSVATSEDSGRGKSISLLFLDEFAFVKPSIQMDFWSAILPTLSTGGSCIMTSTPNGDENLFAQMWRSAEVGLALADEGDADSGDITFYPIQVRWDEPPGRDDKFKKQQISQLGDLLWRQEYECEFLSSDALLIDTVALQQVSNVIDKINPLMKRNDFVFWDELQQSETYLIGIDPSTGSGSDFTVIQVFSFPGLVQVAEFRSNTMSSPEVYSKLKWVINAMEQRGCSCYFSVENNGVGEGVIALYMNDESPPDFAEFVSSDGNRLGMATTGRSKIKTCVNFKQMFEAGKITIKSKVMLKELKSYVRKKGSYEAQTGSTDDCIAATLIVTRVLEEIAEYEQGAFDKLYNYNGDEYGEFEEYSTSDEEYVDDFMPVVF